jgi:predicted TIM-barrel fold metal-dependent hydrolase
VLIDQAGKLKLPVHFHSAVGIGDYFSLRNGNPLNLENVLRDPRYSNVKFVLIHGGYPYTLDMIWLTAAKNVYTDSSLMGYYVYPSELKNILKQWISLYPEKIMFASDAFPFNDAVGAEETFWLAVRSGRRRPRRWRNSSPKALSRKRRPSNWRACTCTTTPRNCMET